MKNKKQMTFLSRKTLLSFSLFLILIIFSNQSNGQDWVSRIVNSGGIEHPRIGETVLLEYNYDTPNNPFPNGRTIMFRCVNDGMAGVQGVLEVTLLDVDGWETPWPGASSFNYSLHANPASVPINEAMVPISAAYNSDIDEYLVCGYSSLGMSNTVDLWYMTFSPNPTQQNGFQVMHRGRISIPNTDLFVTDVTPTEYSTSNINFTFVGKMANQGVAIDALATTTATSARIFTCELNLGVSTVNIFSPDLNGTATPNNNMESFPVCIDEIDAPNGGYIIGGSILTNNGGVPNSNNHPYFMTRLGYDMPSNPNSYSTYSRQIDPGSSTLTNSRMVFQKILYDRNTENINIAGNMVMNLNSSNSVEKEAFIFDEILNLHGPEDATCFNPTFPNTLFPISHSWLGAPGATATPALINQFSSNFDFRNPSLDNIFPDYSNGVTTNEFHVAGRFQESVTQNPAITSDLPCLFSIDMNPATSFNQTNWNGSNVNLTIYPRQLPQGFPMFHSKSEFDHTIGLANKKQAVREYSVQPNSINYIYNLGTLANVNDFNPAFPEATAIVKASFQGPIFNNDCFLIKDILFKDQVRTMAWPVNNGIGGITNTAGTVFSANINLPIIYREQKGNGSDVCPSYNSFKSEQEDNKLLGDKNLEVKVWYAEGIIKYSGNINLIENITIYSAIGQIISNLSIQDINSKNYNITGMPKGIYYLKVNKTNSKTESIKILN